MKWDNHISILIFSLFALYSCTKTPSGSSAPDPKGKIAEEEKPQVEVMDLKTCVFYKEILSNGKLYAMQKADLKFRVTEIIDKINVKNGNLVEKNATIACLNNYTYNLQLQRASNQFDKAKLDMQDVLIGLGYNTIDSTRIPAGIWKLARIKSGLDAALFDLQSAQYNLENTVLKAPFRGMVCNLKLKEYNMATNDAFCTIVDNLTFEAVFQVLESELDNVSVNQPVSIVPFAIDSTAQAGILTEINPLIDENGLVTVKAKVQNTRNNLYEGMNVRVMVRKAFPGRLVVPKQAVVLRTGKEVVFTLEDGRAKWNYVKTGDENATSYIITEGLKSGMKVIISGNLNLGHDAEVTVINSH